MLRLALGSLSVLAYTYAGYPLIIEALSRLAPGAKNTDPSWEPTVSVLIPVYNAKDYIEAKLESLLAQDYPADKVEILVYSDASDDGSDDVVRSFEGRGNVRLVRGERRSGKPTALNVMRELATGEVLVLTDIRQPLSETAIRALVRELSDPDVGTVSGNLVLLGDTGAGFYWHYENRIRRAESRYRSMIGVTCPLYAIRRDDLPEVPTDIVLDDMWIPLQLRMKGTRLALCEEAVAYDQAFEDDRELGRKIRTLAGNFQLFGLMPELLSPSDNPIWFETVSHKLLRLAGPFLMGTTVASSLAGLAKNPGSRPLQLLVGAQLAFGALAALGPKAGKAGGAARTFVVLNYAALAGLSRHVRGSQKITW